MEKLTNETNDFYDPTRNQSNDVEKLFGLALKKKFGEATNQPKNFRNIHNAFKIRVRKPYTFEQVLELEKEFHLYGEYIRTNRRLLLTDKLKLSRKQISTWFQNRRKKAKKMSDNLNLKNLSITNKLQPPNKNTDNIDHLTNLQPKGNDLESPINLSNESKLNDITIGYIQPQHQDDTTPVDPTLSTFSDKSFLNIIDNTQIKNVSSNQYNLDISSAYASLNMRFLSKYKIMSEQIYSNRDQNNNFTNLQLECNDSKSHRNSPSKKIKLNDITIKYVQPQHLDKTSVPFTPFSTFSDKQLYLKNVIENTQIPNALLNQYNFDIASAYASLNSNFLFKYQRVTEQIHLIRHQNNFQNYSNLYDQYMNYLLFPIPFPEFILPAKSISRVELQPHS